MRMGLYGKCNRDAKEGDTRPEFKVRQKCPQSILIVLPCHATGEGTMFYHLLNSSDRFLIYQLEELKNPVSV